MVGTSTNHVRSIMIVKIHSVRNRHNFSTANISCSNQKGWTTTTSNVVRKAPKITQLEHKTKIAQGTSALIYRQGRSVAKKTLPFIPCRLPPPPLAVVDGTSTGTILAFVGGWFKFKLGYLKVNFFSHGVYFKLLHLFMTLSIFELLRHHQFF
jgi:hypothetical protein